MPSSPPTLPASAVLRGYLITETDHARLLHRAASARAIGTLLESSDAEIPNADLAALFLLAAETGESIASQARFICRDS